MDKDMQELSELLDTVTAKVPKLIKDLVGSLYSPEAGANMGKAVGAYYKNLVEAGLPQDVAVEMAKDYALSVTKVMKTMNND